MPRFVAVIVAVLALALPALASAHAQVMRTSPQAESAGNPAPTLVTIEFTEPVTLLKDQDIEVVNDRGETVLNGIGRVSASNLRVVEAPVRADLPNGTYTVRYKVVSADSHIIPGAYAFAIGPGPVGPPNLGGRTDAGPSLTSAWSVSARFFELVGLGGLLGLTLFRMLVWGPAWRSRWVEGIAPDAREAALSWGRDVYWMAFGALAVGSMIAETYLLIVYSASALGTSVADALTNASGIGDVLASTRLGALVQIRGALLFALFALGAWQFLAEFGSSRTPKPPAPTGPRIPTLAMVALIAAVLYGISAQGHASQAPWPRLQIAADMVHVAAAAVWAAGLVLLFVVLRRLPRLMDEGGPRAATAVMSAFSRVAFWSVAVILVTGIVRTVGQVSDPTQLWGMTYGKVLLFKVALLALAAPVALRNRRIVTTVERRGTESAAAVRMVRNAATVEIALSVVIAVAASLLVAEVPGRL